MDEPNFMYEKTQEKIREILNECGGGKYIFRGENRDYGKVSSKLYREYDAASIVDDHMLKSERITVEGARHHVRPGASDIEVLTELQHYGGKTTLIDFTRNLLIALFFACDGYSDEPGRIILFDRTGLEEKGQIKTGKDAGEDGYEIVSPVGKNPRVVFQGSVFVRAPKGYIEEGKFREINIEESLKQEILSYLEQHHDITRDTIYNDLHGFIRNREDNYVQQAYYDRRIGDDESAESYFARSIARFASNDLKGAMQDLDEAIRLDSQHLRALSQRGLIKVVLRDKSGMEDYRRALKIRHDPLTLDNLRCALALGEDYWDENSN